LEAPFSRKNIFAILAIENHEFKKKIEFLDDAHAKSDKKSRR